MNLHCLKRAFSLRGALHADASTNSYRLFGGDQEGIPGFFADRYGDVIIFLVYEGQWVGTNEDLEKIATFFSENLPIASVYLKRYVADRTNSPADRALYDPKPFWGGPAAPSVLAQENKVKFWIHPYDGFSTGIFLDQRDNRAHLADRGAGKKVLNCFAYTCLFSVGCAMNGARTVSVDLSKKYLEWGKKNFLANELGLDEQKFVVADVFDFLRRALKRSEKYDLVILNPPSFSRGKNATFSIEKDLPRLVESAWNCVESGGSLFVSSNFAKWEKAEFGDNVRKGLNGAAFREERLPETPLDFRKNTYRMNSMHLSK